MPKTHSDFPDRIFFNCTAELRQQLIAFAYLRQSGGMYASIARDLIYDGIQRKILEMTPRQKADFDEILKNVKIQDAIRAETKKAPP